MRQGKQVAALTCLTHDSGVIGTEDSDLMGKSLVEDMGGLWIGLFAYKRLTLRRTVLCISELANPKRGHLSWVSKAPRCQSIKTLENICVICVINAHSHTRSILTITFLFSLLAFITVPGFPRWCSW